MKILIWYFVLPVFSPDRWVCLCRLKGAIRLDHRVGRHRARPGTGSLLLEIPAHRQTHCLCLRTLPNRMRPLKRKCRPLTKIHAWPAGVAVVDVLGKNIIKYYSRNSWIKNIYFIICIQAWLLYWLGDWWEGEGGVLETAVPTLRGWGFLNNSHCMIVM